MAGPLTRGKCQVTNRGAYTNWHHPGDTIVWRAYFRKPGRYVAWLQTETWAHGRPWAGDRRVELRVGSCAIEADLGKDRSLPHTVYDRAESRIGTVEIPSPGEFEVVVRTLAAGPSAAYYDLSALRLTEVD